MGSLGSLGVCGDDAEAAREIIRGWVPFARPMTDGDDPWRPVQIGVATRDRFGGGGNVRGGAHSVARGNALACGGGTKSGATSSKNVLYFGVHSAGPDDIKAIRAVFARFGYEVVRESDGAGRCVAGGQSVECAVRVMTVRVPGKY